MSELDSLIGKIEELATTLMQSQIDQYAALTVVLNLILRSDDRLRSVTAEGIRKILITPVQGQEISPGAAELLRSLRDGLMAKPKDEVTQEFNKPTIRPVD